MKRTVNLTVHVRDDQIVYVVANESIRRMIMLIRPDDLDYIRGDTTYAKTVEGDFTFNDGKPTRAKARKRS